MIGYCVYNSCKRLTFKPIANILTIMEEKVGILKIVRLSLALYHKLKFVEHIDYI